MSDSDSDEDLGATFFTAAREDDDEEERAFPVGDGGGEDDDEDDEEEVEAVDLGLPLFTVFNRSWFSVPRVARTSSTPGVVRCYDRVVMVESAEKMGALLLDHKAWPTREALLDLVAADQVVVLQGQFKDDVTLRYVWGVMLTCPASSATEDNRIFRTLPKRVYGELLSAYTKDAELVGSSLLDMESSDNNSRSFNPTICGWTRVTLEGFPRTAAVTPSKDAGDKLVKPPPKKTDPKLSTGTIFDARPSAGASAEKPSASASASTPVAVARKPVAERKLKKAGVLVTDAPTNKSSVSSTSSVPTAEGVMGAATTAATATTTSTLTADPVAAAPIVVAPTAAAISAASKVPKAPPPASAPLAPPVPAPRVPAAPAASAPRASSVAATQPALATSAAPSTLTNGCTKRKLSEAFEFTRDETSFEMNWPAHAKGAKVTVEYF